MYFRQVRLDDYGCASYIVGSNGEAVVVDPRWDIEAYLRLAERNGLRIVAIVETHVHADHVSGNRRLAERTVAPIYHHEQSRVTFPNTALREGDRITVGDASLVVLHTPGHSPDSICLLVQAPGEPDRLLTGDTLFLGDVGRPDLHGAGGAEQLYDTVQRLQTMDDALEIWPAHLAGSLCGRSMHAGHSTVLGVEKARTQAFHIASQSQFVEFVMASLPVRPPNIDRILATNRAARLPSNSGVLSVPPRAFRYAMQRGAQIVDIREPEEFWSCHIPGALSIPLYSNQFGGSVAWLVRQETPLLLVASDEAEVREGLDGLAVTAVFSATGYLDGGMEAWIQAGETVSAQPQLDPDALDATAQERILLVDVREPDEFALGSIPGAVNIPFREMGERVVELPMARPVVTFCQNGMRSGIAASLLVRHGLQAANLRGGIDAWHAAGASLTSDVGQHASHS